MKVYVLITDYGYDGIGIEGVSASSGFQELAFEKACVMATTFISKEDYYCYPLNIVEYEVNTPEQGKTILRLEEDEIVYKDKVVTKADFPTLSTALIRLIRCHVLNFKTVKEKLREAYL